MNNVQGTKFVNQVQIFRRSEYILLAVFAQWSSTIRCPNAGKFKPSVSPKAVGISDSITFKNQVTYPRPRRGLFPFPSFQKLLKLLRIWKSSSLTSSYPGHVPLIFIYLLKSRRTFRFRGSWKHMLYEGNQCIIVIIFNSAGNQFYPRLLVRGNGHNFCDFSKIIFN